LGEGGERHQRAAEERAVEPMDHRGVEGVADRRRHAVRDGRWDAGTARDERAAGRAEPLG
jgi:hypothetical protein